MRKLVLLLSLAVVVAGCGGGGKSGATAGQSHTVRQVSKAFYDAGIPFTTELLFDPSVNGQQVFLPGKLNSSSLRDSILAGLSESNTNTHSSALAWVFDTDAHATAALKMLPISQWVQSTAPAVRVHDGNVVIVALAFQGAEKQKLDQALAALAH
jgi:hypothetical protein